MGSTPRQHRYQVPMTTRSTDCSTLDQCPGKYALTLLHEDDQAEASFFELGTTLHDRIEAAIDYDHDLDIALAKGHASLGLWEEKVQMGIEDGRRVLETSKRGIDTIHDDFERMLKKWFLYVHPDGDKRHPIYDDYEWPPKTEVKFFDSWRHVWGSVDAIFDHKAQPDHVAIVDWKSGLQKQKTSFQLHFYTYGMGVDPEGTVSWFHHLDRVRKNAIVQMADEYPGDEEMARAVKEASRHKVRLLSGEMPEFNPDWWCNFCPVQDFCPADGDDRNRDTNRIKLESVLHLFKPMSEPIQGE